MNKKRLLKLAADLEADAKAKDGIKFDLESWGHTTVDGHEPGVDCGTTACALGFAALSGLFKRQGLTYRARTAWHAGKLIYLIDVVCDGANGFEAAAKLFDIRRGEAEWLFGSNSYRDDEVTGARGERLVAKRIREFVK